MTQEQLIKKLEREGYHHIKEIPGRGLCGLMQFVFTVGLCYGIGEHGYEGRYCYPNEEAANAYIAFQIWGGKDDPQGKWIVHKGRGGDRQRI